MQTGQKVVCINDTFTEAWVHVYYKALPKKDQIYTVRDVRMGRENIQDTGLDSMVMTITLEELRNDNDPHYKGGVAELGFNSIRFKELEEVKEKRKLFAAGVIAFVLAPTFAFCFLFVMLTGTWSTFVLLATPMSRTFL